MFNFPCTVLLFSCPLQRSLSISICLCLCAFDLPSAFCPLFYQCSFHLSLPRAHTIGVLEFLFKSSTMLVSCVLFPYIVSCALFPHFAHEVIVEIFLTTLTTAHETFIFMGNISKRTYFIYPTLESNSEPLFEKTLPACHRVKKRNQTKPPAQV